MPSRPAYSRALHPALAGFVLAGGKSTRMGRDKALLEIEGEPLAARTGRIVKEAAGSAVIIGDPRRYRFPGFEIIADEIPGLGPIGGLLTALEHSRAPWNLIVACDMPSITVEALRQLIAGIENAGPALAVVPLSERGVEPLCAIYHRECLPEVRRAIRANRLRMKDLADGLPSLAVPGFNARVFDNVNRPAEWSAYIGSS
jgi:molybdenum cofactor guanylyltransferase